MRRSPSSYGRQTQPNSGRVFSEGQRNVPRSGVSSSYGSQVRPTSGHVLAGNDPNVPNDLAPSSYGRQVQPNSGHVFSEGQTNAPRSVVPSTYYENQARPSSGHVLGGRGQIVPNNLAPSSYGRQIQTSSGRVSSERQRNVPSYSAVPSTYYGNQARPSSGHVLGGGDRNVPNDLGIQNRTERLEAQYSKDIEVFKKKQAEKEAKKREEFLKKTAKYAGYTLGSGETLNNEGDLKCEENVETNKDLKENHLNQHDMAKSERERVLQMRTERLQAQYNRDVQAFKEKQQLKK